jgi:hypothetical protein
MKRSIMNYWQNLATTLLGGDIALYIQLSACLDVMVAAKRSLSFREVCQAAATRSGSEVAVRAGHEEITDPDYIHYLSSFTKFATPATPATSQLHFTHRSFLEVMTKRYLQDLCGYPDQAPGRRLGRSAYLSNMTCAWRIVLTL